MKKLLICIGFALALSACGTDHVMRFNISPRPSINTEPSYKGKGHFFFWGIGQNKNYNLINACPVRGVNTIETYWTWYDSLMGGLTMGIYAPESHSIYCN